MIYCTYLLCLKNEKTRTDPNIHDQTFNQIPTNQNSPVYKSRYLFSHSYHLQRHQSSTLKKPQKTIKYDKPCNSGNYQDPLECLRILEHLYFKIHAKYPCYHTKDGNNKCRRSKQQLKLYELVSYIILSTNKKKKGHMSDSVSVIL